MYGTKTCYQGVTSDLTWLWPDYDVGLKIRIKTGITLLIIANYYPPLSCSVKYTYNSYVYTRDQHFPWSYIMNEVSWRFRWTFSDSLYSRSPNTASTDRLAEEETPGWPRLVLRVNNSDISDFQTVRWGIPKKRRMLQFVIKQNGRQEDCPL